MNKDYSDMLAELLDSLDQEQPGLDMLLNQHPDQREELSAYLDVAKKLQACRQITARTEFRVNSPKRLMRQLPSRSHQKRTVISPRNLGTAFPFSMKTAVVVLFLIILSLGMSGTVYASTTSLPGDALYPVKRTVEDIQLFLSSDEKDLQLESEFLSLRVNEIEQLIQSNRENDLNLAVEAFSDTLLAANTLVDEENQNGHINNKQSVLLEASIDTQVERLTSLLQTAPEQAKPALENALLHASQNKQKNQDILLSATPAITSEAKNATAVPIAAPTDEASSDKIKASKTPQPTKTPHNQTTAENNDEKVKSTSSITHGPPDWVHTKNPKVPTKKP